MDRETRKSIKHDRFVDEVQSFAAFAQRNVRQVLAAVGGALILVAIITAVVVMQRRSEQKAQLVLSDAISEYESPLKSESGEDAPGPRHESAEARMAAAQALFETVEREYGRTDAADVARLYLAQIHASRGDHAGAIPLLETFVGDHPDHILASGARVSLYHLRIAQGATPEVIVELEGELAATEKKLPADVLLAILAQAYELSGQSERAQETYQRLISEFPDSPYSLDAQRKLTQG